MAKYIDFCSITPSPPQKKSHEKQGINNIRDGTYVSTFWSEYSPLLSRKQLFIFAGFYGTSDLFHSRFFQLSLSSTSCSSFGFFSWSASHCRSSVFHITPGVAVTPPCSITCVAASREDFNLTFTLSPWEKWSIWSSSESKISICTRTLCKISRNTILL